MTNELTCRQQYIEEQLKFKVPVDHLGRTASFDSIFPRLVTLNVDVDPVSGAVGAGLKRQKSPLVFLKVIYLDNADEARSQNTESHETRTLSYLFLLQESGSDD
ncbi:hypothetical protein BGZ83_004495, partial [Gryganskiella cystojenkinii]